MFINDIPKPKFHHPDVFPEGGASIQSIACYSEQYAWQFCQVFHLKNSLRITAEPDFKGPSHILIPELCG